MPPAKPHRRAAQVRRCRQEGRYPSRGDVSGLFRRTPRHLDAIDGSARTLQSRNRWPLCPQVRSLPALGGASPPAGRRQRRHDLCQRPGKAGSGLEVRQVRPRPRGRHHDGEGNGLHARQRHAGDAPRHAQGVLSTKPQPPDLHRAARRQHGLVRLPRTERAQDHRYHQRSPANRRQQVEGADRRPCADGKGRGRLVAAGGSSLRPPASPSPHAQPAARLQPCRRPS